MSQVNLDFLNEESKIEFIEIFGRENFYLEIQSKKLREQVLVNQKIMQYAIHTGIGIVLGDDAHYLKKEDRFVHKAYLNSVEGEREVDTFYQYAYLHSEEDCIEDLTPSFEGSTEEIYKYRMKQINKEKVKK